MQFALAAGDRGAVQAGDLGEQGKATPAVLLGQEAHQEAPRAFVRSCHEAVDAAVLPSQSAVRVLLACGARTRVRGTRRVSSGHTTLPPLGGSYGTRSLYQQIAEVIIGQPLSGILSQAEAGPRKRA